MTMKKTIVLLISSIISTTAIADGCQSLANSNWSAKLSLITGVVVTAPVHIGKVIPAGDGLFILKGEISNESFTADYGCVEQQPGQIRSVLINTTTTHLASHTFSPDRKNPFELQNITGVSYGTDIDDTDDKMKSYIRRR